MAKIEYLGQLSDKCGREQNIALPHAITDISTLRLWLSSTFEADPLNSPTIRAIVNGKVVAETQTITNEDTIAFFPPVGGG